MFEKLKNFLRRLFGGRVEDTQPQPAEEFEDIFPKESEPARLSGREQQPREQSEISSQLHTQREKDEPTPQPSEEKTAEPVSEPTQPLPDTETQESAAEERQGARLPSPEYILEEKPVPVFTPVRLSARESEPPQQSQPAPAPAIRMSDISRYFERDARRYDSGF